MTGGEPARRPVRIAVCGRGGVGRTTLVAALTPALAPDGPPVEFVEPAPLNRPESAPSDADEGVYELVVHVVVGSLYPSDRRARQRWQADGCPLIEVRSRAATSSGFDPEPSQLWAQVSAQVDLVRGRRLERRLDRQDAAAPGRRERTEVEHLLRSPETTRALLETVPRTESGLTVADAVARAGHWREQIVTAETAVLRRSARWQHRRYAALVEALLQTGPRT